MNRTALAGFVTNGDDNFPYWAEATHGKHELPQHTHPAQVCPGSDVGTTFHRMGYEYIPQRRNPNTER